MCDPLHISFVSRPVERATRELTLDSCNTRSYTTGVYKDNTHAQRAKFDAQCIAVGMQSGLGSIVRGAVDMRHEARDAANLDDHAFGMDQERSEDLAHAHDGEEVDFEKVLNLLEINIKGWNRVVAAGVVDEDV